MNFERWSDKMKRRYFASSDKAEVGRHRSYKHKVEGKYAFKMYQGGAGADEKLDAYKSITKELQEIIAECIASNKEVRAQGSSWSLSKIGLAKDRLINSKQLRLLQFNLPEDLVSSQYLGDHTKLRFLECGESIAEVNKLLFREGLSLKASGSNNGQTLAGALSTGTHGGAFDFGAIPEFVVGLHLVVGPSKHVYLQRKSTPVIKKEFADVLDAQFLEDDELFNAALVSFGSFGIIQGIMIEARDLFILHATRFFHPFNAALKNAISSLDFSGLDYSKSEMPASVPKDRPYHFQVFFNPNEKIPPDRASVLIMFEDDWDKWSDTYTKPEWDNRDAGPGASGLEVVGAIYDILPSFLNDLMLPILNGQLSDQLYPYYQMGTIGDLFAGERVEGELLVSGTAVPMSRALETLEIALQTYKEFDSILPLIISSRFVKGTTAMLGFTKFDQNCTLEIDTISTGKSREFLNLVRRKLGQAGIPFTLHWGKLESYLTPTRVRNMYGDAVDRWLTCRKTLLENEDVQKVFTNKFMTRLELV